MGFFRIPSILLLLSCFLILFLSPGLSGKVMEIVENEDSVISIKESAGKSRKMIGVMDYADPGPNTNTKNGYFSPPPPPPV